MDQPSDQHCSIDVDIYFNNLLLANKTVSISKVSQLSFLENSVMKVFSNSVSSSPLEIYVNDQILNEELRNKPIMDLIENSSTIKIDMKNLVNLIVPRELTDLKAVLLNKKRQKLKNFFNGNRLESLKNGRRIFNNKNDYCIYKEFFNENFIGFNQLFYEDLQLNEDFSENKEEKVGVESMILCTYAYQSSFIEPLIISNNIKSIILKDKESKDTASINVCSDFLTYIHPEKDIAQTWGTFHSKLMILKFNSFLRVVVPTANLTSFDWNTLGQIVWFQDFDEKDNNCDQTSDFEKYLHQIFSKTFPQNFESHNWFKGLGIDLSKYDFSKCCVDLVASFSGRFSDIENIGIGRIRALVKKYGIKSNHAKKIVYQASSFGSIKEKFLHDFVEAFLNQKFFAPIYKQKLDIIFPSLEYIKSIEEGRQIAKCLFLQKDIYSLDTFPKKTMKPPQIAEKFSKLMKSNLVCHSKILIVTKENFELDNETLIFVGSQNFSPSAWGFLEKNNSQIKTANYEVGILFDPTKISKDEKQKIIDSYLISLFHKNYFKPEDIPWTTDYHH